MTFLAGLRSQTDGAAPQGEVIQLILAKEAQDAIEARELAKLTYKRPQRQKRAAMYDRDPSIN